MKFFTALLFCALFPAVLFGQGEQKPLEISHLTGDYYIFTTYNSYKGKLIPANALYLVTTEGVVLFDSPWDSTQFQPLLDSIEARHHKKAVMCIATHSHGDRTGGLEFYKDKGLRTYTSALTDQLCIEHHEKRAEYHFKNDTVFTVGNYSFRTCYAGEGHTKDNIVIWFDQDKILYGGCLVKSTEATDLGFTGEANMQEWPATIRKIKKKFGRPKYVIPGHQGWSNPASLEHTLKLLEEAGKKGSRN